MVERLQERPNPNPSIHFESLSLNEKVVFSKELTFRQLLHLGNDEGVEGNLLGDVPFLFEVRNLGDSFLNIASFSKDQPLAGKNLLSLLNAAKSGGSSRGGQDRFGIMDDWDIILPEVRARDPRKKALYDHHKENVPGFSEFEENHFPQFWDELKNPKRSRREIEDDLDNTVSMLMSTKKALATYGFDFFKSNYGKFAEAVKNVFPTTFGRGFVEFLKTRGLDKYIFGPFFKEYMSSMNNDEWYDAVFKRVSKLSEKLSSPEIEELIIDFYNQLSDEERRGLTMSAVKRFSPAGYDTVLVDEDTGNIDKGWSSHPSIEKTESNLLEIRHWQPNESYVRFAFVLEEQTGFKEPKIAQKHIVEEEGCIAPIIIWKRDKITDEGSYFCGQIPQELIQSHPHLFSERHDTLLGKLMVSAYSSKVRNQMPKQITMRGTDGRMKTQQLLEAQSVLLVPMHDQMFLEQSPVILGLEKLSKS